MQRIIVFILAVVLLVGCSSPATPTLAPTPLQPSQPVPQYAMMGSRQMGGTSSPGYIYYVVIDKGLDNNRTALKSIADDLCKTTTDCQVTFWDDKSKAATGSTPMTDAQMNAYVAIYNRNPTEEQLSVCGLNEC